MSPRHIPNRPTAAELRRRYIDERETCAAIAKSVPCDPTTVRLWLVAAGIPTRPRGSNENRQFKKGGASPFKGHRHDAQALEKIGAASRARGAVPYMVNGQHWLKGAPPEMNPRWLGGITPERQAFYQSAEWKEACTTVWWRSDACCERCSADARDVEPGQGAFHVHHIISFKIEAFRADPANLVLLCRACHLWVHSNANVERDWIAVDGDALAAWHALWGSRRDALAERAWAAANDPSLFDLMAEEKAA